MEDEPHYDFASWEAMEPELKEAACSGDLDVVDWSKPSAYWLTRFIPTEDHDEKFYAGNILHLAIWHDRTDFVKTAIEELPVEVVHQLLCQQETAGQLLNWNPLHLAVFKDDKVGLVKQIVKLKYASKPNKKKDKILSAQDSQGRTPALLAIQLRHSTCASILVSKGRADSIKNIVDHQGNSPLFLAIQNNLPEVASSLLDYQDPLCIDGPNRSTALHVAPGILKRQKKRGEIYPKLFKRFPEHINVTDDLGFTMLHKWVEMGDIGPLKSFIKIYPQVAVRLMLETDSKDHNNPLHLTATSVVAFTKAIKIAKELVGFYRKYSELETRPEASDLDSDSEEVETTSEASESGSEEVIETTSAAAPNLLQNHKPPWLMRNNDGYTPLLLAIRNKRQDLACYFLKEDPVNSLSLGDQEHNPLILAHHNGYRKLARKILVKMASHGLTSLLTSSDGANILHFASHYKEWFIIKVIETFPSLINQRDGRGDTPLDKALEEGADWVTELLLKKEPLSLKNIRNGWITACEKGHVSVILSFIKYCPHFTGFCLGRRDTPLHHIKLGSYAEYQEFLVIDQEVMKKLRNTQDVLGETPLHKAIRRKDIDLTEALLTMDDISLNIKDNTDTTATAMDLLADECKLNHEWGEMCKRVKIDPTFKTTYVQRETDLLNMREGLLVVAALLAAITFQAGFTLPGGLHDSGIAVLANKAAFLVFLLADAIALCCSILVLFCLIWSMICDRNISILLIDRSMVILLLSLYASLVAFMMGVFTVIPHKSLWSAIIIIVMCSLVGISAINWELLHLLLKYPTTEHGIRNTLLKLLGKSSSTSRRRSSAQTNSTHDSGV